jgi:hypothetical protein
VESRFKGRARIVKKFSVPASEVFEDLSLDFVFLDARHDREGFEKDIEVWFPKVKYGGWIGGHDYNSKNHPDVKPVVDEMFRPSVEVDKDHTWMVRKP